MTKLKIETEAEKTKRENTDHCKSIAENLEAYTDGSGYKCPHCGEVHQMTEYEETEHENEDGETCYTCPNCSEEIEENDLEAVSIYDYLTGDIFDIEYRIGSDRQFRSVKLMVACGGPNIYIEVLIFTLIRQQKPSSFIGGLILQNTRSAIQPPKRSTHILKNFIIVKGGRHRERIFILFSDQQNHYF